MTFSITFAAIVCIITLPLIVLFWATESKTTRARRMRRNGHTFKSIAKSIRMSETTARNYCKVCAAWFSQTKAPLIKNNEWSWIRVVSVRQVGVSRWHWDDRLEWWRHRRNRCHFVSTIGDWVLMTYNNNLPSEVEIRRLMKTYNINRTKAIEKYLRERIERLG